MVFRFFDDARAGGVVIFTLRCERSAIVGNTNEVIAREGASGIESGGENRSKSGGRGAD